MRDTRIDFLRFLGLSLIIFAHVDPPNWSFQLRNFDVPLMVLVSGLSFSKAKEIPSYGDYFWKRIRRVLLPMWLFLSGYLLVLHLFWPNHEWLELRNLVSSYALLGVVGVPYVWIIRVFLLVAAIAPGIALLNRRIKDNSTYLMLLAGAYGLYELLLIVSLEASKESSLGKLLALVVYYAISYGLIFALGLRFPQLSKGQLIAVFGTALGLFLGLGLGSVATTGQAFPNLQLFKYPPTAYYLSYAVAISSLLWLGIEPILSMVKRFKPGEEFILFCSRNSMWLYLWHIPFVEIFRALDYGNIGVKFLVAYSCAALMTGLQSRLIRLALMPKLKSDGLRRNVKLILTG